MIDVDLAKLIGETTGVLAIIGTAVKGSSKTYSYFKAKAADRSAKRGTREPAPVLKLEAEESDSIFIPPCLDFSNKVAAWFKHRYDKLEEYAKDERLNSESADVHREVLDEIARNVDGFPGGIYTIDAKATVAQQHTPLAPGVPLIQGYDVSEREYYRECYRQLRPIVCNAFLSANRPIEILVVAVPRFNKSGHFIGILDGVVDITKSPFSKMAKESLDANLSPDFLKNHKARLLLVDMNKKILGSSMGPVDGRLSIAENPTTQKLFHELEDDFAHATQHGAIATVDGTPFFAICHEYKSHA